MGNVIEKNTLAQIEESQFRVVFCERFNERSGIWNFDRHNHKYMEILFFLKGNANIEISEKKLHVSLYNLVVYPAGVDHQEFLDPTKNQEVVCLWIDSTGFVFDNIIHVSDHKGRLEWLLLLIFEEWNRKDCLDGIIEHYIKVLFIQLIRAQDESFHSMTDLITHYITENFSSPITIKDLAELVYVSESYLIRRFRQKTGQTPIQYINSLRIEAAKRLLATKEMTIEDISQSVGYGSAKYFTRLFKKYLGVSPSDFRKSL